jgi:hypothetical protein
VRFELQAYTGATSTGDLFVGDLARVSDLTSTRYSDEFGPDEAPSHMLTTVANSDLQRGRYVVAAAVSRRWRLLRPMDMTSSLTGGRVRWHVQEDLGYA